MYLPMTREEMTALGWTELDVILVTGDAYLDSPFCGAAMLGKVLDLRVFPDAAGRLNRSLRETGGGILLVSQFTLYADTRRGRRPSFSDAAPPDVARLLYDRLATELSRVCPGPFGQGVFGAEMLLDFVNWGPVTLLLDSSTYE